MIFRDHQPLAYGIPACPDGSRFYYKESHLSLTKVEDVPSRMKAVLRKGQPYFVSRWGGEALNREVLEWIVWTAFEAAREKGKYIRLSVNYRQAVMGIAVLESQLQETIYRGETSEGEPDDREKRGGEYKLGRRDLIRRVGEQDGVCG